MLDWEDPLNMNSHIQWTQLKHCSCLLNPAFNVSFHLSHTIGETKWKKSDENIEISEKPYKYYMAISPHHKFIC